MSIIYPSSETATTVNRAVKNVMGTTTTTDGAVADGLIISENLQPVVECTPGMDYKITDKTITGVPPLSFHAIAQHLFDWSIDGNTDSGDSVGDKTDNLFDDNNIITIEGLGERYGVVLPEGTYSIYNGTDNIVYSGANNFQNRNMACEAHSSATVTLYTAPDTTCGFLMPLNPASQGGVTIVPGLIPPTSYTPYGYDVPIVVNNTDTYHCYISDVLRKSSGETPVYDTMSSDGTITRRVDTDGTPLEEPTTETYTAPDITVKWGWNTVDVDTTVAPSNMIINYKDD